MKRLRAHKVKTRESVAKSLECVNEKNCIWRGENASRGLLRFKQMEGYSRAGWSFGELHKTKNPKGYLMGKDLPILSVSTSQPDAEQSEEFVYARVFCQKENSPPLKLLIEFLQSRGQSPILPPQLDEAVLQEWAWVQVALGYDRDRKPLQLFCVRDRGSYRDVYDQEKKQFIDILSAQADVEAQLALEYVTRCRFILTTRIAKDVTDEGYDFNGWILEFYQEQCDGIVQIDNQGFYSPKGDLIVDLSISGES